jgi:hypothetical protein
MFEGLITANRQKERQPTQTTTPPLAVAKETNDPKPTQSHNEIDLRQVEDTDFFTVSSCIERHRLNEEPEPSSPAINIVPRKERATIKGKELVEKTNKKADKH